jgi:hypothetical protein
LALLAAGLFVPLFAFRAVGPLDFWWWMGANIVVLVAAGALLDRGYLVSLRADSRAKAFRKMALGLASAAVLYGVFFIGNLAARALFSFAAGDIGRVYGFKAGVSTLRVVLLLALLIGPGEELFWRAWLQRRWQARLGRRAGFLAAAALYALVHAASGNLMLVLAAAVCGLFWGWIYMRTSSALLVAVSHIAWDLAVFAAFPFQ